MENPRLAQDTNESKAKTVENEQGRAGSPAAERYAGLRLGPGVLACLCRWLRAKWDILKVRLPGVQVAGSQEWRKRYLGGGGGSV